MIPTLMQVKVSTRTGTRFGIWLPLFLVWLLLLLAPLLLLALLVVALFGWVEPWRVLRVLWGIVNNLSGLDVDVQSEEADVLVRVW